MTVLRPGAGHGWGKALLAGLRGPSRLPSFAFLSASMAACLLPFLVGLEQAEVLVRRCVYPTLMASLGLFVFSLAQAWKRPRREAWSPRERWVAAGLVGTATALALAAEPFRCKVIWDEYVLQGTAYSLHHHRIDSVIAHGYKVLGEFLPLSSYLDKRPGFFPFLVSLVHDLTGYRAENAFYLNAVLYPSLLLLAYVLGRRLHGPFGGRVAVALLGTLPLLGQAATGSGMDLLNVCMILVVASSAVAYLGHPSAPRLDALLLGTVLLAHSRYESALYVLPVACVVLMGWRRRGAAFMTWPSALVPILLLPCALRVMVMNHKPVSWELSGGHTSRFAADNLVGNLKGAAAFLFASSPNQGNSVVLTLLGLAGAGWVLVRVVRRRGPQEGVPESAALLPVALGIAANTGLLLFYYWSRFDHQAASRFSLPLYLGFAMAAVQFLGDLKPMHPRAAALSAALSLLALAAALGRYGKPLYSVTGAEGVEWQTRFISSLPPKTRLVLTSRSALPWLLEEQPALPIFRVPQAADRIRKSLEAGDLEEVLVIQSLDAGPSGQGSLEVVPEDRLPEAFSLVPLAERKFGPRITRISRVAGFSLRQESPDMAP